MSRQMSTITLHPTKQSALAVVDEINTLNEKYPESDAARRLSVWTYSVVQNAGGHWIVQIHDADDEFVGTL